MSNYLAVKLGSFLFLTFILTILFEKSFAVIKNVLIFAFR